MSLRFSTRPAVSCGLATSIASAQVVPRALIISNLEVPGSPGRFAGTVTRIAPSHIGGVVATLSTRDGVGSNTDFQLWGSQGDSSLTRLDRTDANGSIQITRFDDTAGANGTQLATLALVAGNNAVIADGQLIAVEGDTNGPSDSSWTTFIGLHLDSTGFPWFQAHYDGTISGAGFFRRTSRACLDAQRPDRAAPICQAN